MARIIEFGAGCDIPAARRKPTAAERRGLAYNAEVKAATDHLYDQVKEFVTPMEWPAVAPFVHAINQLKKQRGAVILAHNYMTPDVFRLVGDFRGDSLQLAHEAARTDAKVIVQAGVHFMAETSKILCPDKVVLIPDLRAGCSLAASITAADVRLIRSKYPGLPIVTYVNTTADVKAECDITCTSSNAVQVVEHVAKKWGTDRVILIPDEFLARNVAANTNVKIIAWKGRCEVHEKFSGEDVRQIRDAHPGVIVLAHPECPPDVLEEADFAGSTSALSNYVKELAARKVVLLTECSMSDNVAADNPGVEFVKPCNLCPHMKRISLENIYDALKEMKHAVEVPEDIRIRAKAAIDAMLALPKPKVFPKFKVGAETSVALGAYMRRLIAIAGCSIVLSAMAPAFADDVAGDWAFDTSKFADNDCKISGKIHFKPTAIKDTYTCLFESEQVCGKLNFNLYIRVQQSCTAQRIGKQVAIQTKVDKILEVRPKDYPTNYLADNFIVQLSKNLQEMNGQHYDAQRHLQARFWRDEQLVS